MLLWRYCFIAGRLITLLFHDNFTSPFNAISALKKRPIGNYSLLFTFYAAKRAFYATFVSQPFFCVIIINENAGAFLRGVFSPLFIIQQVFYSLITEKPCCEISKTPLHIRALSIIRTPAPEYDTSHNPIFTNQKTL